MRQNYEKINQMNKKEEQNMYKTKEWAVTKQNILRRL